MTTILLASSLVVGAVAAARSTWSPCGLSMLATITPLAERGRGHRYLGTAAWFVVGGTAGGLTLGLAMSALAAGVDLLGPCPADVARIGFAACLLTAAAEVGLGGFRLPVHRRQVNERWLDGFRPWVYAGGFGWQVGTGVATYIVTPALYLMIVLAVLAGSPWAALAAGTAFGLLRGLAVLLGRGITSSTGLSAFHRRFAAAEPVVWWLLVAVECATVLIVGWALSPWVALTLVVALPFVVGASLRAGRAWRHPGLVTQAESATAPGGPSAS